MRKHVIYITGLIILASAPGCSAVPFRAAERSVATEKRTQDEKDAERKQNDVEREATRAERMRRRVLRKMARYNLSDEFLREREVLGALLLRHELEKIVPKNRDEVRALLVTEEGRVRALLTQPNWKQDIREKLEAYMKALAKIIAQRRSQSHADDEQDGPLFPPAEDDGGFGPGTE